jgi:glycosyltransferase
MYEEAVEFFSDAKNRITMIYNAIDDVKVSHLSQSGVEDNRINKPFILTVMRLEEIQKDITTLIKAYRILCETYHHSEELYVIGKGDSLEQLQATANECGVSDQVHFLGFKSNPYPWIRKCKIFVQSSKYEGLPTTMIEALFLDKIIVATDCPTGPREILDGGNAGLLTPLKDASALAKAMHVALTDTSLQERIHEEIKKHRFVFSFESSGKKLEQLF